MSETGRLIFPVFLPMQGCPSRCIYCDQHKITAVAEPELDSQWAQAREFILRHPGKAKEIAFYGGSFTALPWAWREQLISRFDQIADPHTSYRISTHPAFITPAILEQCRLQGIRCIELGVQDFSTEVLHSSKRGYDGQTARRAAQMVKKAGFDLGIQLMPGLPGSDATSVVENHQTLSELIPDYLRLYPVIVLMGTPLADMYQQGAYQPLALDEAIALCADYCELAAAKGITVIKVGLPSNLNSHDVLAGPWHPAFGEFVQAEMLVRKLVSQILQHQEINLDKKQQALLNGHGGKFQKVFAQRLANCFTKKVEDTDISDSV